MDFKFSAEDEAFRAELKSWLDANLPRRERSEHAEEPFSDESAKHWQRRVAWHKKMHSGGWVGISWPKEYGGRGATLTQQLVYGEEMSRAMETTGFQDAEISFCLEVLLELPGVAEVIDEKNQRRLDELEKAGIL